MNIQDIKEYYGKRVRIVTSTRFTYIGTIESYGEDYIKFRDKYQQLKFISLRMIDLIEEVKE